MLYLLLILSISHGALAQLDCAEIGVEYGSTWMNISWNLHCNLTEDDIISIRRYHLILTDQTTGVLNYDLGPYCTELSCTEYLDYIRPCIAYNIELSAELYDDTEYTYNSVEIEMDEELPTAPRNLDIKEVTPDSLSIDWFQPQIGEYCVHHYQVCSVPIGQVDNPEQVCEDTTDMNFVASGLAACTEYSLTVLGVTKDNIEGLLSIAHGVTSHKPPGKPEGLRPKSSGTDYVSFYWNPSPENVNCVKGVSATCIETVFQDKSATDTVASDEASSTATDLFSEVNYLNECTNYNCSIKVPNKNDGTWVESDMLRMATSIVGGKISEPQNIEHNSGPNWIKIFWSPPLDNSRCVDGYYLSWQNKTFGYADTYVAKDVLEFEITNLEACIDYDLSVCAATENWGQYINGSTAQLMATTKIETPGPVQNLVQQSSSVNTVTMCWDPPIQNSYCTEDYKVEISLTDREIGSHHDHKHAKTGENICGTYQVKDCSEQYTFCIWPESKNGEYGEKVCTVAQSSDC